jgi:3-deoxy-D-manno-octulosonic-acid transferase
LPAFRLLENPATAMRFLYSSLLTIGYLVLLPRYLARKNFVTSLRERLGRHKILEPSAKPVIWIHCVSVGETQAARPLVKRIREEFPEYRIVVSNTTATGHDLAEKVFADDVERIFYFPFDWRFAVRRALQAFNPAVILILETEIWFNFIDEAKKYDAMIAIINGRLSEKSAGRYALISKFIESTLRKIDLALVQTTVDARRLISLGISHSKVKVTGSTKFDQPIQESESRLTREFRERFFFAKETPLIIAASTHAPEERILLEAFKSAYKSSSGNLPRLLIAPRHPERFDEVAKLIEETGFTWVRRSDSESEDDELADVVLLDSIGELREAFPCAQIVFVGGSLIPHGGQNILEAAVAEKPIITGNYTSNFAAIINEFEEKKAIIRLPRLSEKEAAKRLAQVFIELLSNEKLRRQLAENSVRVMLANRGATEKTLKELAPLLESVLSTIYRRAKIHA